MCIRDRPNTVKAKPSFWLNCTVTGIGFPAQGLPFRRLVGPTSFHVPAKSARTSLAEPVAPTLRSNVAVEDRSQVAVTVWLNRARTTPSAAGAPGSAELVLADFAG